MIGTCSLSWQGRRDQAGSDCLLKTQVHAKSQDDVYGLTPARCWNVKGTVSLRSEAENLSASKRRW